MKEKIEKLVHSRYPRYDRHHDHLRGKSDWIWGELPSLPTSDRLYWEWTKDKVYHISNHKRIFFTGVAVGVGLSIVLAAYGIHKYRQRHAT